MTLFTAHYNSPLGGMTMASEGQGLAALWFDGTREDAFLPPCRRKPLVVQWVAILSALSFLAIVSSVPTDRSQAMAADWSGNVGCWRWK